MLFNAFWSIVRLAGAVLSCGDPAAASWRWGDGQERGRIEQLVELTARWHGRVDAAVQSKERRQRSRSADASVVRASIWCEPRESCTSCVRALTAHPVGVSLGGPSRRMPIDLRSRRCAHRQTMLVRSLEEVRI